MNAKDREKDLTQLWYSVSVALPHCLAAYVCLLFAFHALWLAASQGFWLVSLLCSSTPNPCGQCGGSQLSAPWLQRVWIFESCSPNFQYSKAGFVVFPNFAHVAGSPRYVLDPKVSLASSLGGAPSLPGASRRQGSAIETWWNMWMAHGTAARYSNL